MAAYLTNDELLIENNKLKAKINKLEKQLTASNKRTDVFKNRTNNYKKKICELVCEDHYFVMKTFEWCKSIRDTADECGLDMEVLYELIPIWYYDYTKLNEAKDYENCMIQVMGRKKYDAEEEITTEEINIRNRTPDLEEMNKIILEYNTKNMSLYNLADKYNLKINNLFRLLKENKLIENETDANGYYIFYTEHNGTGIEWDFETGMGLI
jgi:hypothetical protein